MQKVKDLIKTLQQLDPEKYIDVACENTIFTDFEINEDEYLKHYVIFGLSGSEIESWEDVANNKYDRNID